MNIDEIRKEMTREEFLNYIYNENRGDKGLRSYLHYKGIKYPCPYQIGLKKEYCEKSSENCYKCWLNAIKYIQFKEEKVNINPSEIKRSGNMNKTKLHEQICSQLNEMYIYKNHDYGDSFGETFRKLGIISAVTRITDKVNRLQSLCSKDALVDEKIEDTLLDLANYSIMALIELELNKENINNISENFTNSITNSNGLETIVMNKNNKNFVFDDSEIK